MNEQIEGLRYKANGRRVYPNNFKLKVVDDCRNGLTAAEAARKYQILIQNIVK